MSDQPEYMAVHSYQSEPLMDALVSALREHAGEDVNGVRSIDAGLATVALVALLAQLTAPMPRAKRRARLDDINQWLRDGVREIAARAEARTQPGGAA